MRRSPAKFSESVASNHTPSLADFTTTTPELKFSVHTVVKLQVWPTRSTSFIMISRRRRCNDEPTSTAESNACRRPPAEKPRVCLHRKDARANQVLEHPVHCRPRRACGGTDGVQRQRRCRRNRCFDNCETSEKRRKQGPGLGVIARLYQIRGSGFQWRLRHAYMHLSGISDLQ
jgi:hypothetical protein